MQFRLMIVTSLCLALLFGSPAIAASKDKKEYEDNWLAVMDLSAPYGVEKTLAKALTGIVIETFHRQGRYQVMSPADIEAVAKRAGITESLGDCDGYQCLLDFGRKLGARYMVAGEVSKIGSTYLVTLKFLDTGGSNPGVVDVRKETCNCGEDDLIAIVERVATKLMSQSSSIGQVEGASLKQDDAEQGNYKVFLKEQPWENYKKWFCSNFECPNNSDIGLLWVEPTSDNLYIIHLVFPQSKEVFTADGFDKYLHTEKEVKQILYSTLEIPKNSKWLKPKSKGNYLKINRSITSKVESSAEVKFLKQ